MEAGLFRELALRRLERRLAVFDAARRQLEQRPACRHPRLAHEGHAFLAVDRDDRHRWAVDDDVLPIALLDVEHLPFEELHRSDSTYARRSASNANACAFDTARSGFDVAGMTASM